MDPRAAELIATLGLQPHPEGGYYRELFRSTDIVTPADGRGPRTALTTIYFLLTAAACSRWQRPSTGIRRRGGPLAGCAVSGSICADGMQRRAGVRVRGLSSCRGRRE